MDERKERAKAAARALADAVNEVGFDVDAFADELCRRQHRTLQQNAFRAFARCVLAWAQDREHGYYDLRNDHTTWLCERIVTDHAEALKHVPYI